MRTALLTLGLWVLSCMRVHADELVVLRERDGLRPGLCGALRIQLSDLAEVRCEPDDQEALTERLSTATERVARQGARLGVLLERDPDPGQVRMYIVTSQRDQAVIAIERIEDRADPDVDRSLALEVRGAFELVSVVRAALPSSPVQPVGLLAVPRPEPGAEHTPVQAGEPGKHLLLDVGGGAVIDVRTRLLAHLVLGVAWWKRELRLEGGVGARLLSTAQQTRSFGHVSVVERGPHVALRALFTRSRFALGAALDATLLLVSAQGIAPDGSRGRKRVLSPTLALALDGRVRLFQGLFLRFAPGIELMPIAHGFSVDERVVFRDGRVRALLPLSLVVSLPAAGNTGAP